MPDTLVAVIGGFVYHGRINQTGTLLGNTGMVLEVTPVGGQDEN